MTKKNNIIKMASLIPYEGSQKIEAYVLKFPESIYNEFLKKFKTEKNKVRNMKISELNSSLLSIFTDIYFANFIKKSNIEDGWIFASHPEYLEEIKYQLNLWLDSLGINNLKSEVESMSFEYRLFDINEDDIRCNNSSCKLLLSFLSKSLAEDMNLSIKVGKKDCLNLDFIYVNNDDKYRVLALFPDRKVTLKGDDYYYNYFFEIYPVNISEKHSPCIGINVGKLMMAYENAKTVNSNMYPYIIVRDLLSDGEYKATAFKGRIIKNNNKSYSWDRYVMNATEKVIGKPLPDITKLIENPTEYIGKALDISVLIPHGTHMVESSHDVGSGVDLKKRTEILDLVGEKLFEYEPFNRFLLVEKDDQRNTLKKHKCIGEEGVINLDLLYTNEETRDAFEHYINLFNNKDLTLSILESVNRKKELEIKPLAKIRKEINEQIKLEEKGSDAFESLTAKKDELTAKIKSIESEIESYCEPLGDVSIESLEKLYITLTHKKIDDMLKCININLNTINYSESGPYSVKKGVREKLAFKNNLKSLRLEKDLGVAIVELKNKDSFLKMGLSDPKNLIRSGLAECFNKATQFTEPLTSTDKYDKINKIILECLRQKGYVHTRENIGKSVAQVGISKESEEIILTCIINDKTYGKFRNKEWMEYNEFLVELASIKDVGKYNYSPSYIEDCIDDIFSLFGVESCTVHLLSRQFRNVIPGILTSGKDFNLKMPKNTDASRLTKYKNENVTVIVIDDTINAEWFPYIDEKSKETSFYTILAPIDSKTYFSICSGKQGVLQQHMGTDCKINREDTSDTISKKIFKSEPILMHFVKVADGVNTLDVARIAHHSKTDTSIQHYGAKSTEETKLPIALNIAKISTEYILN